MTFSESDKKFIVTVMEEMIKSIVLPSAIDKACKETHYIIDNAVKYRFEQMALEFRATKFRQVGPFEIAIRKKSKWR